MARGMTLYVVSRTENRHQRRKIRFLLFPDLKELTIADNTGCSEFAAKAAHEHLTTLQAELTLKFIN
jgi:hypothetical protein